MKKTVLTGFALLAIALGACNQESQVNAPLAQADNAAPAAQQSEVNAARNAELTDMFYLGEDVSAVLTPSESADFNSLLSSVTPAGGELVDPRLFLDIEALTYFRLIMMANPDLTAEQRTAIQEMIRKANEARRAIMADQTTTREQKLEALKALNTRLMNAINGVLTPEQLRKTKALMEKIAQQREAMHQRMLEARIAMQIRAWNRLLNFTDRQVAGIKDILRAQDKAIQDARERFKDNPEALRQAILDIQKRTNAAIRALLDEKQRAIWDRMHARTGGTPTTGGVTGTRG